MVAKRILGSGTPTPSPTPSLLTNVVKINPVQMAKDATTALVNSVQTLWKVGVQLVTHHTLAAGALVSGLWPLAVAAGTAIVATKLFKGIGNFFHNLHERKAEAAHQQQAVQVGLNAGRQHTIGTGENIERPSVPDARAQAQEPNMARA